MDRSPRRYDRPKFSWRFVLLLPTSFVLPTAAVSQSTTSPLPQIASSTNPTIAGRIINGLTGAAISRALVQAGSYAMLTDHDGHFLFSSPDLTNPSLQVTRPGFALSPEQLDSQPLAVNSFPDRSSIEIRLYPEAVLTGTVTDPDGTPLSHIPITVRRSTYTEAGHLITPIARPQTDTHGNYRVTVPAGDYLVSTEFTRIPYDDHLVALPAEVPQLATDTPLHVRSGDELRVDLSPALTHLHTVTMAASTDQPGPPPRFIARSAVGFVIPASGGGGGRSRRSEEPSIELPSGTFTLEATVRTPAGEDFGQTAVTVPDHDIAGVSMRFTPIAQIPIEIATTAQTTTAGSASAPAPSPQQLSLTLRNVNAGSDPFNSRDIFPNGLPSNTGITPYVFRTPPGRYHLATMSGSPWYVVSATYGATDLLHEDLVVAPAAGVAPIRLLLSNNTGSLSGSVKLSGLPAACWVYAVATDPSTSPVSVQRSSAEGLFTFAHLPPGSYRLLAFEHKHSADLRSPQVLATFTTRVEGATVSAGEQSSVSLEAIPVQELLR